MKIGVGEARRGVAWGFLGEGVLGGLVSSWSSVLSSKQFILNFWCVAP